MLDRFWDRFKEEYLTKLLKRGGGTAKCELKIGDLVLMESQSDAREYWRILSVVEITNDEKSTPRTVRLRDSSGKLFTRHVKSLVKLELSA